MFSLVPLGRPSDPSTNNSARLHEAAFFFPMGCGEEKRCSSVPFFFLGWGKAMSSTEGAHPRDERFAGQATNCLGGKISRNSRLCAVLDMAIMCIDGPSADGLGYSITRQLLFHGHETETKEGRRKKYD